VSGGQLVVAYDLDNGRIKPSRSSDIGRDLTIAVSFYGSRGQFDQVTLHDVDGDLSTAQSSTRFSGLSYFGAVTTAQVPVAALNRGDPPPSWISHNSTRWQLTISWSDGGDTLPG
jgi:hypothetical protein